MPAAPLKTGSSTNLNLIPHPPSYKTRKPLVYLNGPVC
ncbi:hypothetical protein D1BOALGB6SA_10934, partial [Olavius sp. associated proteobacterium Delta 1]